MCLNFRNTLISKYARDWNIWWRVFHWYGSGGHQWFDRKTEATETSKASVNRSYENGNYVEIIETNNSETRTTKNPSLRPFFFKRHVLSKEKVSPLSSFLISPLWQFRVWHRWYIFQLFEMSIDECDRREVTPRGLPCWVHKRLEWDTWSKLIVYVDVICFGLATATWFSILRAFMLLTFQC